MYFSGKITNNVLLYLSEQGFNSGEELTDIPRDLLRDPSCWLNADDVESFLKRISEQLIQEQNIHNLLEQAGHSSPQLHCWGVLDSVLRMIVHPQDIFSHPQRLLYYFISPSPHVEILEENPSDINFFLPLSQEKYPYIVDYLRAALEAIPLFMGRPLAVTSWTQNTVSVAWNGTQQGNLLTQSNDYEKINIKPELRKRIAIEIENAQRDINRKDQELHVKDQEIQKLRLELKELENSESYSTDNAEHIQECAEELKKSTDPALLNTYNQFMRLSDYLTRAQQLITLLVGQDRADKGIKKAMDRVKWDVITPNIPQVVQEGIDNIENIKNKIKEFEWERHGAEQKVLMDLDRAIENAVVEFTADPSNKGVHIEHALLFSRSIFANPQEIESMLCILFKDAKEALPKKNNLRVATHSQEQFVEIEVGPNEPTEDPVVFDHIPRNQKICATLKTHGGEIKIIPSPDKGAKLIINLPLQT